MWWLWSWTHIEKQWDHHIETVDYQFQYGVKITQWVHLTIVKSWVGN